jgi:hypothetical protein
MTFLRTALTLVAVTAVAAIAVASALAGGGNSNQPASLIYPSSVSFHLVQTEALLNKAATYNDEGDGAKAVTALNAASSHMHNAWLAEKYLIDNTPPPATCSDNGCAGSSSVVSVKRSTIKLKPKAIKLRPRAKARRSGNSFPASPFADQFQTGVAVLSLQHDVASTTLEMLVNANATVLPAVSTALTTALKDRDTAIAYMFSVTCPATASGGGNATPCPCPASASDGRPDSGSVTCPSQSAASSGVRVKGHTSGNPLPSNFSTLVPSILPYLNDELAAIKSLLGGSTLASNGTNTSNSTNILNAAFVQITKTAQTVSQDFPIPAGCSGNPCSPVFPTLPG